MFSKKKRKRGESSSSDESDELEEAEEQVAAPSRRGGKQGRQLKTMLAGVTTSAAGLDIRYDGFQHGRLVVIFLFLVRLLLTWLYLRSAINCCFA